MPFVHATRVGGIVLAAALIAATEGRAATYEIVIDSPAQTGIASMLAFDLTNGDGASNNTITLESISHDGTFGATSVLGGASGALPDSASIVDTAFLNELLQSFTLGQQLRFRADVSAFRGPGSVPDQLSFFVLDAQGGVLFGTSDPTGAGALFTLDFDGSPNGFLRVFTSTDGAPAPTWSVTLVPEPASVALLGAGLALLAAPARRARA